MIFRRKAYDALLAWKHDLAGRYSALLEGARRVGKSTVAEEFARKEYESYLFLDFSNISDAVRKCFDDIADLDTFFLRLQAACDVTLIPHRSVIVFDEIQLFPRARQAIKHLVRDGRYHYIETGSLISIKKNVKDILIPSEEHRIPIYPMDYEEFLWATGSDRYEVNRQLYRTGEPVGQQLNRRLARNFRIYMAVGGMPQAVVAYTEGRNFSEIDAVKREILNLYEADFKRMDPSGRVAAMYRAIPAQLAGGKRRYTISAATGKRKSARDEEFLFDLMDSKTALISYNTTDPRVSLSATKDLDSYKIYIADTGLFVTLMFGDRPRAEDSIYTRLLSDKLPANLGYLYENMVAQMIVSSGRELYYHTWEKKGSTHYYELDFLISEEARLTALEVKSSGTGKHESLSVFREKYARCIKDTVILSQKDAGRTGAHRNVPIYMAPYLLEGKN